MTKVAVALSGGVDSAVTAALLLEQGFEVIGVTAKMFCSADAEQVAVNAKSVADKLGIDFVVYDAVVDFKKNVVDYFENSYINGETPNPCIMCNKYIKWGCLFDYVINELGVDYIATGHYANIKKEGEIYNLYPASDEHKDQLYFLFSLNQNQLSKTLFPLSGYKKEEVKQIAQKYDLPPKSAKESQDICFIKTPMTTKKYLNERFEKKQGYFVEKISGKVLGKHDGFWQYTIGQRKGIGIAAPAPLYVLDINSEENVVYVGYEKDLYSKILKLENIDFLDNINKDEFEALVKIRYNMQAVKAVVKKDEISWEVEFQEPVAAITKGQACVFYDVNDGHLIGGSFI